MKLSVAVIAFVGVLVAPPASAQNCDADAASCGDCVDANTLCGWCDSPREGIKQCGSGVTENPCSGRCGGNDCKVSQCDLSHTELWIIIVPVAAGVLLIFGCLFYCYCCRGRTKARIDRSMRKEDTIRAKQTEERDSKSAKRKEERNSKLDEYRQKYNVTGNKSFAKDQDQDPLKAALMPGNGDPYAEGGDDDYRGV